MEMTTLQDTAIWQALGCIDISNLWPMSHGVLKTHFFGEHLVTGN